METELRRCRSNLSILGSGVIVFSIWEILKPLLVSLLVQHTEAAAPSDSLPFGLSPNTIAVLILAALLLAVLSVVLRLCIGLSARAEAAGKRRGKAYVILAFLIFALQVMGFLLMFLPFFLPRQTERALLDTAASLLVELSSTVITGELAFTAARFKKLSKLDIG